jgi:hypothetical protein
MKNFAMLIAFAVSAVVGMPPSPAAGTWNIAGDVQGVPVLVSCLLTETNGAITGTCVDEEKKSHAANGTVKEQTVAWSYPSEYQGTPIVIRFSGKLDAAGAVMSGTILVNEYAADGTFSAKKLPVDGASAPAV